MTGEKSDMPDSHSDGRNIKGRLRSFSWYLGVATCASMIIASGLFIVFLNLAIKGKTTITSSDVPFIWVIPFLTCLASGGAMGNVKSAIKLFLPILFLSLVFTLLLTSLPVILGYIPDVSVSNLYIMSVLSTDSYVFILAAVPILGGILIGAFLGGK